MSSRRQNANANRIRGPQSALTDFLAANNISAQQIRNSYEQRTRNTTQQDPTDPAQPVQPATSQPASPSTVDPPTPELEVTKKRKRSEGKGKGKENEKHKVTKRPFKANAKKKGSDDEYDEEDGLGRDMYQKAKPVPGQFENCEICSKRFTVTAYSKTGPDGGLVCMPCGKELVKDSGKIEKKVKKPAGKGRRKTESNRLDGILINGPKTLQQLCIEKVADQHQDIEELGDLPDAVLFRLSEIFARRRVLDPRTFRLFLRPDLDTVAIHDCAKLEVDDYIQLFAITPRVSKLILRNASQFKDVVMKYLIEKATNISHFQVYAANLVSNDLWKKFFISHGHRLETLKLTWLDASFNDDVLDCMVQHCPNLRRLKLKLCRQLTKSAIPILSRLSGLQHLSLQLSQSPEPAELLPLITALGPTLETLSLQNCFDADDTVTEAIRTYCTQLSKFRLTSVDCVSDAAFRALFSPDSTVPPLSYVDFDSARDVDNNNPNGPQDAPMGFASEAFKALMAHSGYRIRTLRVPSCRHISHAAWCDVFADSAAATTEEEEEEIATEGEEGVIPTAKRVIPHKFPELEEIDLSFCNAVDTAVMKGIFRKCPKLKKLVAFGCFNVDEVVVPRGLVLVGLPRAQDQIEQFGDMVAAGVGVDVDFGGGVDEVLLGGMGMGMVTGRRHAVAVA